ncbi:hypothetical protein KCV87_06170 [Actinosynnema pretiosum subsp. pretiosum]|uniref:VCBS repeat-containing protein n=1 Tax=Actinosynnema pretiosum subsp. pretiosum TaxID=103721 RepID=A0AA45L9R9_9PSEU|nr:hypothetical protein KCV87_06170 [Actinosynnema pretiosum subsp. pretiosum]
MRARFAMPALALAALPALLLQGIASADGVPSGGDASADATTRTAFADLDGDGNAERITVDLVKADDPARQRISAVIGGVAVSALTTADGRVGVQPVQVVDLNDDGRQEVVAKELMGANTDHYTAWGYHYGTLSPVTNGDDYTGAALRFHEGGGISALSYFGCEGEGAERKFKVASAVRAGFDGNYDGTVTSYRVENGIAKVTEQRAVTGSRSLFWMDARSCA